MECPYCYNNMEKGFISGVRDDIKWIEESRNKGAFVSMFQKGIKLTDAWISNQLETYYCVDCKKMIIDVTDRVTKK